MAEIQGRRIVATQARAGRHAASGTPLQDPLQSLPTPSELETFAMHRQLSAQRGRKACAELELKIAARSTWLKLYNRSPFGTVTQDRGWRRGRRSQAMQHAAQLLALPVSFG